MGSMPLWKCVATLSAFLVSCSWVTNVHGLPVMSIDLSSEWVRVVAFMSDAPTEKAITEESMGKFASAVAFVNGERLFGEDALQSGVNHPSDCYVYFLDLVGKKINNPIVQQFKKRFPQYKIIPHTERNTVLFKCSDSDEYFSPEDLVSMLLGEAKALAKYLTKEDVKKAVITVPSYFGQAERLSMLIAADICGIEILQLFNSNTAAALNYGTLHVDKFYKTAPVYVMFFNMDSYGTQASVVSYQLVKSEDEKVTDLQPQLTVLGVSYERHLGSLEVQLRLRDYLALQFNSLNLTFHDITKDPIIMARLFVEAGRLVEALSTKTEHLVKVKTLIGKKDMELKVTREKLNKLCFGVFSQVVFTSQEALDSSGITAEDIEKVILVGTATKFPQVQENIAKYLRLSQKINIDEAVVMGAAYKAARFVNGFEVKPFITKDATLFPVQVLFHEDGFDDSDPPKPVNRILFGYMEPFPKHHFITFNKHLGDITFDLDYINEHSNYLSENKIKELGSMSLGRFFTDGLQEAYSKNQGQEGVDTKGIEVCISIDQSGLIVVPKVKLIVEKSGVEDNVDSNSDSKDLKAKTANEKITLKSKNFFVVPVRDEFLRSIDKSRKLKQIDLAIARKRISLHNLLEAIYSTHFKLNKPEYASAITDAEKQTILDKIIELSHWLARGGTDAVYNELDSKYDELKQLVTKVQVNAFEKLIFETTSSKDDMVKKQEKLSKNVDAELPVEKIKESHTSLEGEMSKLTFLKSKFKAAYENYKNPNAETLQVDTADEKAKIIVEKDIDNIMKTMISQGDRIEEINEIERNSTEEDNILSEDQIKAKESWLGWLPDLIRKTSQNDEL